MVRVKICGITNARDARACVDAGADYIGFVLFGGSPRFVSPDRIRRIIQEVGIADCEAATVGVFVDEPPGAVAAALKSSGLQAAQLHGREPASALGLDDNESPLRGRAYKGLRPASMEEAERLAGEYALAYRDGRDRLPSFLLDANHPVLPGGTGHRADWRIAAHLAGAYRLMLAGGLKPDNVRRAVDEVRPWAVDVASGVESSPGRKDLRAVREFIEAAKGGRSR